MQSKHLAKIQAHRRKNFTHERFGSARLMAVDIFLALTASVSPRRFVSARHSLFFPFFCSRTLQLYYKRIADQPIRAEVSQSNNSRNSRVEQSFRKTLPCIRRKIDLNEDNHAKNRPSPSLIRDFESITGNKIPDILLNKKSHHFLIHFHFLIFFQYVGIHNDLINNYYLIVG